MASELNPDAPEFQPKESQLKTSIDDGYNHMNKAIRISNTFPIGASYDLFQTFTDFNVVMSKIRKNVINQYAQVLDLELPSATIRCDENYSNSEKIVDANDNFLDKINVNVDTRSGVNQSAAAPAAWNRTPVLATVKVGGAGGSASLITAKNIPRPQLSFKDPVDNSARLFVPRISDKPNGRRPLALTLLYDEEGQPIGYEHPYKVELEQYRPPEWALAEREPAPPPPPLEDAPPTIVSTPAQLDELLHHLAGAPEIAVDLEHHSYRSYQGFTCLIQMTTDAGGDFIVDALALRDHLYLLNDAFTDPAKVKVFHGADNDVLWLQRDFGVYLVGLFDTHQAARLLALDGLSLKHLLRTYCSVLVDKTHQLADWRIRPLPAELVRYARGDTHHLLQLWRLLAAELRRRDPALLPAAFRASAAVASKTYSKPAGGAESQAALYARSGKVFRRAQLAALGALCAWRDAHARALDESPGYLMPGHMALALAEALPRDMQGLRALASPLPPFLGQNIDHLHRIILACRELPDEACALNVPANIAALAAAPPPRDALLCALDVAFAHATLEESGTPEGAGAGAEADLAAFAPPTPPASPTSQLNAEATTFVPPYERYKMYRVLLQAEEVKAQEHMEAKVTALGHDDAVRDAVMTALQAAASGARPAAPPQPAAPPRPAAGTNSPPPTAETSSPPPAAGPASPPVHVYRKPDKCSRQAAATPPEKPAEPEEARVEHRKRRKQDKPFDYRRADYAAFHHRPADTQRRKHKKK